MRKLFLGMVVLGMCCNVAAQNSILKVDIDTDVKFQTIHNFGASDAWAAQYVGLWPDEKRNQVAE
ncbi:hypothetical protein D9O36_17555 [Zobellia amurskyensis]|uniref:Endo-beta-1,6-galactanase-like domain-containing protein n=1 Tax=Zobellia amurskyensis TaxID=248905 RepID=A0A7X2ZWJ5_9FLAO|nr:hypothetical protein [Zobellia amurskyensis]